MAKPSELIKIEAEQSALKADRNKIQVCIGFVNFGTNFNNKNFKYKF